jgi:hypothetical protein
MMKPDKPTNQGDNVMPFANIGAVDLPGARKTKMEPKILSLADMDVWALPPFQREVRQTAKVVEFAEELRGNGGMIAGVIHLGMLPDDDTVYLVDGQQRRNGCHMSGLEEFYADTSLKTYSSLLDMAEDFKKLNGRLVPFRPDDMLRAYEIGHEPLQRLREACPFIGYASIRRADDHGPLVGMSAVLKCWFGAALPTPGVGTSAIALLDQLDQTQCELMIVFLLSAHSAWGRDKQYYRLWSNLNLTMCMYLYRKLLLEPKGRPPLSQEMFRKCLMSVSANSQYQDWLQGRNINDRDRSPCYKRLKAIFVGRLTQEYNGKLYKLPAPDWVA